MNYFENQSWLSSKGLKCIVICGGKGTRLGPMSTDIAKSLVTVSGKPVLGYIIDYWSRYTRDFIFVVNFKKEDIIKYVKGFDINAGFIAEEEPKGIANALSLVRDIVGERLIMVLGDCLCNGDFIIPDGMAQGVGVWSANNEEDIKRSYSIQTNNDLITNVVEKPAVIVNKLCGMGYYFFDKRVFDYIKKTAVSERTGRVEITDVLQTMINRGEGISPVFFDGDYLNVTFPDDIKRAEKIKWGAI